MPCIIPASRDVCGIAAEFRVFKLRRQAPLPSHLVMQHGDVQQLVRKLADSSQQSYVEAER